MAVRPTTSQARQLAELLRNAEPAIRQAFMASVADLQANVDWRALLAALESGNTEAAIAALHIHPAAWAQYSAAVTASYAQAGASTTAYIRQSGMGGIGVRFNMADPGADSWIRRNVAESVVGFTREQIEVARATIGAGFEAGNHSHAIARDLAGRVGPNGTRVGGVLGLDAPRAERLGIVRQGMRTPEGVQDLVEGGKVRYKVNPATERRILAAYNKGEAVPLDQRLISERQYQNALLKARADTVAQTESASAVLNARDEAWRQSGIPAGEVIKTWRHRRGGDGRWWHIAMAGVEAVGLDTPFDLPDGSVMLYAHDPEGGARNNINCSCAVEYTRRRVVG